MENKPLSFKAHVDKKDLQAFSQALMEQTIALQVENQKLKEKLEHLEELLKATPVTNVGGVDVIVDSNINGWSWDHDK